MSVHAWIWIWSEMFASILAWSWLSNILWMKIMIHGPRISIWCEIEINRYIFLFQEKGEVNKGFEIEDGRVSFENGNNNGTTPSYQNGALAAKVRKLISLHKLLLNNQLLVLRVFMFCVLYLGPRRGEWHWAWHMGQANWVSPLLHFHVRGTWEYMEVPFHGLREWRRCFSHSLHHRSLLHRETYLFFGNVDG
jgi:hypothetical protein